MARNTHSFETIRSEGGLLPPDLLRRVLDPRGTLPGTQPEDYGLAKGDRLNEAITQSWNRLRRHWAGFREAAAGLPDGEPAEKLTNDKWSIPILQELGFGMLPTGAGPEIAGRTYAIKRFFGPTAVHLVGCGVNLDKRAAGVRGAAMSNPHGLVQEFLNRADGYLWAILSNGLQFRILRDNQALSRQSYLEFDLETMFDGEVYSDFVLLWLFGHATRFAAREENKPESCFLEQWTKMAEEQGTRALESLRDGVQKALQILGQGFVGHPKNTALREALRTGQLSLSDFHGELLRVVYRFIFLFVAEDRRLDNLPLLHPRDPSESGRVARERYAAFYGTRRLRDMAARIRGSRHGDLWRQFQMVVGALSGSDSTTAIRQHLALPALGSLLWNPASTAHLNAPCDGGPGTEIANCDLLDAIRRLAFTRQEKVLRPVDYANLGAEELGGVYESLLAMTPQLSGDGAAFTFAEFAGNERKTSGSYYTPDNLVQALLDTALDPVVEAALKEKSGVTAEQALLALKVCDPAVGSGHFLVGAAHRLARHLSRVRSLAQGESEPSPLLYQHALRDVIAHCLYGVDIRPMSAELCRVSLWLEAIEPGKPLSFLDRHIRVGNSLLGGTPKLIAQGIPDGAFTPIEGDDKRACTYLKKRNKGELKGFGPLFAKQDAETQELLRQGAAAIEELPEECSADIQAKEAAFRQQEEWPEFRLKKAVADTWCAAFVIQKQFDDPNDEHSVKGITQYFLTSVAGGAAPVAAMNEVQRLADQYQFFHWHLAFPEVFARGGFDCVLGNPPWEKINLKLEEHFAVSRPEIAGASTKAERTRLLARLKDESPDEFAEYAVTARMHDALSQYFRASGSYPATGISRINLYSLFAERGGQLLRPAGRLGMLFPTGIATDQNNKDLFFGLAKDHRLVGVFDFENRGVFFPEVHAQFRFALLVFCGAPVPDPARFGFFLERTGDIHDRSKVFELTPEDLELLSPESGTAPIFRNSQEAVLVRTIYRRHRTVADWQDRLGVPQTPFNMANDSYLFVPFEPEGHSRLMPLLEGKHIGAFNWRAARGTDRNAEDVVAAEDASLGQPGWHGVVRHYVPSAVVRERYPGDFRLVYRKITNATNERTSIAALSPPVAVGDTLTMFSRGDVECALYCVTALNSFAYDFVARVRMSGTSLTHWIVRQIPMPMWPEANSPIDKAFVDCRAAELALSDYWLCEALRGCSWAGPPFVWDEGRRFALRCELDAAFFHLYLPMGADGGWRALEGETDESLAQLRGTFDSPRDAVSYILDTFPIVRRKDEARHGDYRTRNTILEVYDAMAEAARAGQPYLSRLTPRPGDPSCRHPKLKVGILAYGSLIHDPGEELRSKIALRIRTTTPFPVEYARLSRSRGGAPTVVPYDRGDPVAAEILVMQDGVSFDEARGMLWRRETRRLDSSEHYREGVGVDSVLVREVTSDPCVERVLFTDFNPAGKIAGPEPAELAKRAIASVTQAAQGMDGITYLRDNIAAGIVTSLTEAYREAIQNHTSTSSLDDALRKVRQGDGG